MRILFALFLSLFLSGLSSWSAPSCNDQIQTQLTANLARRESQYRNLDLSFHGVSEINRPRWAVGPKKEVVLLVHGFMGSPDEMHWIAESLFKAGYSVDLGLIPGYGASAKVANSYTYQDYKSWYEREVKVLSQCYSKIHLVGFSTGALLGFDYVISHPRDASIASLALVSPFFTPHSLWANLLHIASSQWLDSFPVTTAYQISHFQDILVMIKNPKAYNEDIPLKGAAQIKIGGDFNLQRPIRGLSRVPVLLFISDQDQVLDQRDSIRTVRNAFLSVNFIHYPESLHAPHHLMSPWVSPVAGDVVTKTRDFIRSH